MSYKLNETSKTILVKPNQTKSNQTKPSCRETFVFSIENTDKLNG
ncbi:hypothetical protein [Sulfurimonas sp.]|nr:hypothetical protein [Sulfurimonas sp.]